MTQILRLSVFLIVAALAAIPAAAQNYDGDGRLRFGVFMQGYAMPADETKPLAKSGDLNGVGIGASFGYDWNLKSGWIIGVEADGVATDSGATINGSTYNVDYLATFRGRLGYHIHPHLLLYGTGGFALNGLHYRGLTTATTTNPNATLKVSTTLHGFAVGGGLEWRFYDTIVFGEYLYTGFETWDFAGGFGINHSIDVDAHQFRVGVKWLYGHDHYVDDVKRRRY
jgi:opacity protein-like surface antigen